MNKLSLWAVILSTGATLGVANAQPSAGPDKAASAAAEKWLILNDKGQYKQGWEQAASYFRGRVQEQQWESQIKSVRGPLGKCVQRKLKSEKAVRSLPGAPDGQYVVIKYETSFAQKKNALETATPMKDKDGQWRVSGYFIQ